MGSSRWNKEGISGDVKVGRLCRGARCGGEGSPAGLQKKGPAKHGQGRRSGCPELLRASFVLGSERGGHGTAVSRAGTGEAGGKL